MFWENLKSILQNLPMVLSDTYKAKDVSLNRLAFLFLLVFVVFSPIILLVFAPDLSEKALPYWQGVAALFASQAFANIGKKAVYAYTEAKGCGKNENSVP